MQRYKIVEEEGRFTLYETGYEDLKLSTHDTLEEAQREAKKWIARDGLSDRISEFYDEVIENYGTILDEKEIKEMIKEYS